MGWGSCLRYITTAGMGRIFVSCMKFSEKRGLCDIMNSKVMHGCRLNYIPYWLNPLALALKYIFSCRPTVTVLAKCMRFRGWAWDWVEKRGDGDLRFWVGIKTVIKMYGNGERTGKNHGDEVNMGLISIVLSLFRRSCRLQVGVVSKFSF